MATIDIAAIKNRVAKLLTPWFQNHEQDAIAEAVLGGANEILAAVEVDTDALQAQLTNLYSPAGADAIGISDAGGFYSGTSVEDALQEIGPNLAGGPFIPLSQKDAPNGVATLGSDSKVPTSQLPALAITDTFVVASQAAMLALTAQRGDVAIRTDFTPSRTFILAADPATTLSNWIQIETAYTQWGQIAGTLSSQTDLNTALNARVADTGDTMTGTLNFNIADNTYAVMMRDTGGSTNRGGLRAVSGGIHLTNEPEGHVLGIADSGSLSFQSAQTLSSTAGSLIFLEGDVFTNGGNQDWLEVVAVRDFTGTDHGSSRYRLRRRVDSTQRGFIDFGNDSGGSPQPFSLGFGGITGTINAWIGTNSQFNTSGNGDPTQAAGGQATIARGSFGGGFQLIDGSNQTRIWMDGTPAAHIGIATNLGAVTSYLDITPTGCTSPNFTATSDERRKDNIERYTLTKDFSNLQLASWTWKHSDDKRRYHGVIAQDVAAIAPEYVFDNDGVLSVDKAGLALEMAKTALEEIQQLKKCVLDLMEKLDGIAELGADKPVTDLR